jgi:hypothetical protein
MPALLPKDVKKMVGACACPDPHKAQLEASLLAVQGINLGRIAQIIQTLEQYAVKYGPQIWADIQVLISLFGGGTPAPAPGPTPAQMSASNPRGLTTTRGGMVRIAALLLLVLIAFVLLGVGSLFAAERLPVNQLCRVQNELTADCPCGPHCPCGVNCQCAAEQTADQEVYALASEEEVDPLQQPPKQAAPPVAAAAAPTFHYETRVRCGAFGCRPYTVVVMDAPTAATGFTASAPPAFSYAVPTTTYQTYQVPVTTYRNVQVPTTTYQSFTATAYAASDEVMATVATGRKGLIKRIREWRAAQHAARVGGCFSCGG